MFEKAKQLIKPGAKVLQLTHAYCADGSGCTVVLNNCPIDLTVKPIKFNEIDDYMFGDTFNHEDYDVVLVTDISPQDTAALDVAPNIILLDHHETALKHADEDKMRYVTQDYCGTALVCEFAEEVFNEDLNHLYEFVELTNDYDMWFKDDIRSSYMNMMYYDLWHHRYIKRFQNGDVNFTATEKEFIKKRLREIERHFEKLETIDIGLEDGCLIITQQFVNEMCNRLMEEEDYMIIFSYNDKNGNCSIRSKYEEFSIGQILESLELGGGHSAAGGMTEKDPTELQKKIEKVVAEINKVI